MQAHAARGRCGRSAIPNVVADDPGCVKAILRFVRTQDCFEKSMPRAWKSRRGRKFGSFVAGRLLLPRFSHSLAWNRHPFGCDSVKARVTAPAEARRPRRPGEGRAPALRLRFRGEAPDCGHGRRRRSGQTGVRHDNEPYAGHRHSSRWSHLALVLPVLAIWQSPLTYGTLLCRPIGKLAVDEPADWKC